MSWKRQDRNEPLRKLLSDVIARCPLSEEEIAQKLSKRMGEEISVRTMTNWSSFAKRAANFPLSALKSMCEATGDNRLALIMIPPEMARKIAAGKHWERAMELLDGAELGEDWPADDALMLAARKQLEGKALYQFAQKRSRARGLLILERASLRRGR